MSDDGMILDGMNRLESLRQGEGGLLTVKNTACPDCGSMDFEMRNYEEAWHEGDIHCRKCGRFIRRFDAG